MKNFWQPIIFVLIGLIHENSADACANYLETSEILPQLPNNFSCVSDNWESLKCTWDPVENCIATNYTLCYIINRKIYPCPERNINSSQNFCIWNMTTIPMYRMTIEYYRFIMTVSNRVGNLTKIYNFHHFANVIPAKPEHLSVINKTSNSALLYWSVPFPMEFFPPGLHHKIAYKSQLDPKDTWKVIEITDHVHQNKKYYNLTDLKYPNSAYDVRVSIKSALVKGNNKWSRFSDITFETTPISNY
ncbi:interleukin-6 receptor subunit beta [Microplitis demolitor]|uniref:interleukin-6 receptor subunit beta n=1 Tax=Microplitis demolitor TaxID=69319 RepID=UPI0004CCB216|nr:interleukin-6 receptor subunit beta [Microplitis demolitor]